MAPKKKRGEGKGAEDAKTGAMQDGTHCGIVVPGPQYKLKTLVGFDDHCISKYRNPAYTMGGVCLYYDKERSPGPKYMIKERKKEGYSFGLAAPDYKMYRTPGPKYKLPDSLRGPFYTMKWRTKHKSMSMTPGPYFVKPIHDAPAFSMGLRLETKPPPTGGPYSAYDLEIVKPRSPKYSMVARRKVRVAVKSPGPVYAFPPVKPTPAYSFGIKHIECAKPYITECDLLET